MIVSDCAIPGNAARWLAGQKMSLLWSMGGWEVWLLIIDNKFLLIREGFKKSKWKFKMAFAMKGEGVSRESPVPFTYFEKWFF